jgi:hypothetical protein
MIEGAGARRARARLLLGWLGHVWVWGELGREAGLAWVAWAARAALAFPFFSPFFYSFSISIPHSMLYLGLLCMYTCVAKHVHTLMGSTRGQLGY